MDAFHKVSLKIGEDFREITQNVHNITDTLCWYYRYHMMSSNVKMCVNPMVDG